MTRSVTAALEILFPTSKKQKRPRQQNRSHQPQRRQSEIPVATQTSAKKARRTKSLSSMLNLHDFLKFKCSKLYSSKQRHIFSSVYFDFIKYLEAKYLQRKIRVFVILNCVTDLCREKLSLKSKYSFCNFTWIFGSFWNSRKLVRFNIISIVLLHFCLF